MSMQEKSNNGKGLFTFKDVQEGYPDYINIVKDSRLNGIILS